MNVSGVDRYHVRRYPSSMQVDPTAPSDGHFACEGCGLMARTQAGPTHRYMTSSAACFARFGEVLAADFSDAVRMRTHQLVVDAWAVQHPGAESRVTAQSVWIHLATLCLVLERDSDPADGPRLHRAMVKRPEFVWLEPPRASNWLRVDHMFVPDTDPACLATEWASSAWARWQSHHAVIRDWLDSQSYGKPIRPT